MTELEKYQMELRRKFDSMSNEEFADLLEMSGFEVTPGEGRFVRTIEFSMSAMVRSASFGYAPSKREDVVINLAS